MDKHELVITRVFDAPIETVWNMWTNKLHFSSWYGSPGKVLEDSVIMDVKPDGRWKSTTYASDGSKYPFTGVYREVIRPTKLVLTIEDPSDPQNPNFELVTVLLKDLGDKTEMTFKQEGHLPEEEYETGLRNGWSGFFDKLEDSLKS